MNQNHTAPTENDLLSELPAEVVAWLVRTLAGRDLWRWLNQDENLGLLHAITRGFQCNTGALRQPIIRNRLSKHLEQNPDDLRSLIDAWTQTGPTILAAVEAQDNDDALIEQLPHLWQQHGGEALILTLAHQRREKALDAIEGIADAVEALENQDQLTPETESSSEDSPNGVAEAPQVLAEDNERIIARLQTQLDEARGRSEALMGALEQARDNARRTQELLRVEMKSLQRSLKSETRRAETAESELAETQKTLDRTNRRLRHVQREHEVLEADDKKCKRQMRRQQEISEDLRKQLAQISARLEELQPAPDKNEKPAKSVKAKKSIKRPQVISPLDKQYIWKADGREFRVSLRELQRRIDANDEEWVFPLVQALDSLRDNSEQGWRVFMSALRSLDRYYNRVLTADTTRVMVDASNVARHEKDRYGRGQLRHLLAMRDELRQRDCFPIHIVADASLPHNIDESAELLEMIRLGEIEITRPGQEADEILAREARRSGAFVVTNDRTFFQKVTPDFEPPRITFRIHDGVLIVDEF